MLGTTVAVGLLALALPFLPEIGAIFGFVPLGPALVLTLVATVAAYIAPTEATKIWGQRAGKGRRQHFSAGTPRLGPSG